MFPEPGHGCYYNKQGTATLHPIWLTSEAQTHIGSGQVTVTLLL